VIFRKKGKSPCYFVSFAVREMTPKVLTKLFALFQALVRIMNLRKYCGSIQFVPAPGYEYGEPIKQVKNSIVESLEQNGKSHRSSYPGPSVEFQASDWRFIDGPFIAVWVNNVPWAAEDIMAAPEAKVTE
jgi:sphingosine kinase